MIYQSSCSFCKGSGKAQSLEERGFDGRWVPNTILDHSLADAWIADDPKCPLRWQDCPCPTCGGSGSYELESTPAKIF